MKRFIFYQALLALTCLLLIDASAQTISSSELIENAAQYDGKNVIYEGEVIGDTMRRGDFAWINVSDGAHTIGVWLSAALIKEIQFSGSYKSIGDAVEVSGIFHRACPEHGGDLDIHALTLRKSASGRLVQEKLNIDKRNFLIVLAGCLCLIWILTLLIRR